MGVEHAKSRRSARITCDSLDGIPEDANIRPLRDQMIVEPIDIQFSKILEVVHSLKPVRGKVLAIGPGIYPTVYLDSERHRLPDHARARRRYSAAGTIFRPTTVKVGQTVQLGAMERGGAAFERIRWGNRDCVICREADVCGVEQ